MSRMYRLTCTITSADMELYDNVFLRSYFSNQVQTRDGVHFKYYSIAHSATVYDVMVALENELLKIGITDYAFNVSSDYLLKSYSK